METAHIWEWLQEVKDPEVPVISIVDLGIVRDVAMEEGNTCVVTITPTYSGCPAMLVIAESIEEVLQGKGIARVRLETQLSPAWTTDWMSEEGKEQLRRYGIAPPVHIAKQYQTIDLSRLIRNRDTVVIVPCPNCGSTQTDQRSQFGSTSCKAHYVCRDCHEPFDYFKSH